MPIVSLTFRLFDLRLNRHSSGYEMIWGDGVAQRVNQAASPAGVGQILFASVALNLGEPSFVGSTLEECPKEVTGSW